MKAKLELGELERKSLQQMSLNHRHRDVRTRAAGLLYLSEGHRAEVVAQRVGVSLPSVYNWLHAWRTRGLCGLLIGHKGGRPAALSEQIIAQAEQIAQTGPLSLRQIAQQLWDEHGIEWSCSLETLGKALKGQGLSYKRARLSLKKTR